MKKKFFMKFLFLYEREIPEHSTEIKIQVINYDQSVKILSGIQNQQFYVSIKIYSQFRFIILFFLLIFFRI